MAPPVRCPIFISPAIFSQFIYALKSNSFELLCVYVLKSLKYLSLFLKWPEKSFVHSYHFFFRFGGKRADRSAAIFFSTTQSIKKNKWNLTFRKPANNCLLRARVSFIFSIQEKNIKKKQLASYQPTRNIFLRHFVTKKLFLSALRKVFIHTFQNISFPPKLPLLQFQQQQQQFW